MAQSSTSSMPKAATSAAPAADAPKAPAAEAPKPASAAKSAWTAVNTETPKPAATPAFADAPKPATAAAAPAAAAAAPAAAAPASSAGAKPAAPASSAVTAATASTAASSGGSSSTTNTGGSSTGKPMPAATPSPSMVGTAGITRSDKPSAVPAMPSTTMVASSAPSALAPRQMAAQITGSTRLDAGTNQKLQASSVQKPTPPRAVELVSRAPTLASQGLPPASAPLPSGLNNAGPAHALTQSGAGSLPLGAPKSGPAAVAVGRAVLRGAEPAVATKGSKPAATIGKKYQFVFVTAEVAPWSKTGGLGEAMDGLPIALAALGHRVMTIAPRYDQYAEAWDTSYWSTVKMADSEEPVHAFHAIESKVDRVFLDHECFLAKVWGKTGSMLYGPEWGKDYSDNQWRFSYFAKATLKVIQELALGGATYGQDCIVLVNDWHASLVPVYLAQEKKSFPTKWAKTRSALIIHNALFQGRFDRDDAKTGSAACLNLPESVLKEFTFEMALKVGKQHVKVPRCLNWMAGGCKFVDRILTVSPTYAWELLSLPEKSVELESIFTAKGVTGIVNGAKETVSPQSEMFVKKSKLLSTFGPSDVDEKKAELKAYLQDVYGLPKSSASALCVFLGRMDLQKGYDFLLAALEVVLPTMDIQVVVVGTGRADLVASSKALAKKFPTKFYLAGWMGPERYALVAGADYMLMPSRWEPCGLAQIESMRFGTLPVISQTGGLVDTVDDMLTGVHLEGAVSDDSVLDPASVDLVAKGLEKCVELNKNTSQVSKMRKAAMAAGMEFTWSNSALQYEAVAEELGAVDILPLCKDNLVTLEADKVVS
ncbi:UDP glucose starch glucosyltransferase [Amphidinium carterae]